MDHIRVHEQREDQMTELFSRIDAMPADQFAAVVILMAFVVIMLTWRR